MSSPSKYGRAPSPQKGMPAKEANPGSSSCLPDDAMAHFRQREEALIELNRELESQKSTAFRNANSALANAERGDFLKAELELPKTMEEIEERFKVNLALDLAADEQDEALVEGIKKTKTVLSQNRRVVDAANANSHLQQTVDMQGQHIKALQDDLDKQRAKYDDTVAELRLAMKESKSAGDEMKRLTKALNASEVTLDRSKQQKDTDGARMKNLDKENFDLKKERDTLEAKCRKFEKESAQKEARMNRLMEDNERYKIQIKDTKTNSRDQLTVDRRETDRMMTEIKKMERQRGELISAFKKQMRLIDVLKRQKVHIEAARLLSFTEEEFIRVMELQQSGKLAPEQTQQRGGKPGAGPGRTRTIGGSSQGRAPPQKQYSAANYSSQPQDEKPQLGGVAGMRMN